MVVRHSLSWPAEPVYSAPEPLAGADQIGVLLARPGGKDERRRSGNLGGIRQWIETVYATGNDGVTTAWVSYIRAATTMPEAAVRAPTVQMAAVMP